MVGIGPFVTLPIVIGADGWYVFIRLDCRRLAFAGGGNDMERIGAAYPLVGGSGLVVYFIMANFKKQ